MKHVLKHSNTLRALLSRILRNERAQGLVEYSLILLLIAVVVLVMLQKIGSTTNNSFTRVDATLTSGS